MSIARKFISDVHEYVFAAIIIRPVSDEIDFDTVFVSYNGNVVIGDLVGIPKPEQGVKGHSTIRVHHPDAQVVDFFDFNHGIVSSDSNLFNSTERFYHPITKRSNLEPFAA